MKYNKKNSKKKMHTNIEFYLTDNIIKNHFKINFKNNQAKLESLGLVIVIELD